MRPKRSVALAHTDIDRRRRRHNVTFGLVYDANGASFKKPYEEKNKNFKFINSSDPMAKNASPNNKTKTIFFLTSKKV
jgi:hypothetical protein